VGRFLKGARFRTTRELTTHALTVGPAPSHTWSFEMTVPAGTVVRATSSVTGSTAFSCELEDEELAACLVPPEVHSDPLWIGRFYLVLAYDDIGGAIEPV
jgi:hypothetical protein